MSWNRTDTYDFYISSCERKEKLYIIDLDGTLILRPNCKNPSYYDTNIDNWFFIGNAPKILNDLYTSGYNVVILTNQNWPKKYKKDIQDKMEEIRLTFQQENKWSPFFFISYEKDKYRKPNIGSLEIIGRYLTLTEIKISGDAIGETNLDPKFSWRSTDFDYYQNVKNLYINTSFVSPDELIPGNAQKIIDKIIQNNHSLIIMMGNQGSGKSTFSKQLSLHDYVHIEKDKVKNEIAAIKKELCGKKVIIDATNPSVEKRLKYLDLSENCCIVWMIRDGRPYNKLREKPVPEIAYNIYSKNFELPSEKEGCKIFAVY